MNLSGYKRLLALSALMGGGSAPAEPEEQNEETEEPEEPETE